MSLQIQQQVKGLEALKRTSNDAGAIAYCLIGTRELMQKPISRVTVQFHQRSGRVGSLSRLLSKERQFRPTMEPMRQQERQALSTGVVQLPIQISPV